MSSRQGRGHRLTVRPVLRLAFRLSLSVLAAAAVVAVLEGVALESVLLGRPSAGPGWRVVDVLTAGAVLVVPLALLLGGWRLVRRHAQALGDLAVDDLTGVLSRRAFGADLPEAVGVAFAGDRPLTLALVELTGVVHAVDLLGRRRTEALVSAAAATLGEGGGSPAYRLAGEVFAVVLSGVGPDRAFDVVDPLLEQVARSAAPLSAVAGLCTLDARCPDAQLLLVGASAALDEARALGPGRVVASAESGSGLRWVATPGSGTG
jgi:GGDEF domain-containing protein